MGLLDNNKIIVSKQTKTGSATIASLATGKLISITNTDKQFRTLQITIKATLADSDGDKTFSWYWYSTQTYSELPLFHTKDGYVYMTRGASSDYGSNLSLEELHDTNLNYYNAKVYERTFYVDVSDIQTLNIASRTTNANISLEINYTLFEERLDVFDIKAVQPLLRVDFVGDGATRNFGGIGVTEIRQYIPGFKFIYVAVVSTDGAFNLKLYHRVPKPNSLLGYNLSSTARTDEFRSTDGSIITDWQEVKGRGCYAILNFDTAPASGHHIELIIYGVR